MDHYQVKVDNRFFARAKNEYSYWIRALWREFIQNCVDAPNCDNITITTDATDNGIKIEVANNGDPMDKDTLINKLLALGGTTKTGTNNVGGMGVAKNLLYLCHEYYHIHTGTHLVKGSGGEYTIEETEYYHGTKSTILVTGAYPEELERELNQLLQLTNWNGTITVNGQTHQTKAKVTNLRKAFPWGKVYTGKLTRTNLLVVRVNGIPMFSQWCDYRNTVVIELDGSSTLTANRDGLQNEAQSQLNQLLNQLTTNKRAALKQTTTQYTSYQGQAIKAPSADTIDITDEQQLKVIEAALNRANSLYNHFSDFKRPQATTLPADTETDKVKHNPLKYRFIIKNDLGMTIPKCYLPETFSDYSKKLAIAWITAALRIAELVEYKGEFSVGFIFDEDAAALFENTTKYGPVLYINPIQVTKQQNSQSRSLKRSRNFTAAGKWSIIADCIHEFTHMLGYESHNEDFANKITDLFALALHKRSELL